MIKIKNQTVLAAGQLILEPEDDVWIEFQTKSWNPKFRIIFSEGAANKAGKVSSIAKEDHGEVSLQFLKGASSGVTPLTVAHSQGKPITFSAIVDHSGPRLLFTYQFCLEQDGGAI
jgi:hypothetical protein